MNTQIYKTPFETTSMRVPKKVFRSLVFLALCTIGFPLWAQPGKTCSNPMNLGTLRDTVMTLTLSYPQTDLWLRFSTNQPRPFLGVGGTGAQQVKWQQANVYSTCAQNLTNLPPNPAPGRTGMSLTPTLTSPGTYLLHLKRFYTTSGADADTGVSTFRLGAVMSPLANCSGGPSICGNVAPNGGMETFDASIAAISPQQSFPSLCQWEPGVYLSMTPFYFNSSFPLSNGYGLPLTSFNNLVYNPPLTGNSGNPAIQGTSNGIIGIETAVGSSDIVRLPISGLNIQLYFVSYDVTAGRNYGVYNNRVDLDVSTAATYNVLNYPSASYNPTIVSGAVTNGIPSNQWTTKSCVFQGNPNLQNIFIGNLGQQQYSALQSGIPGQDCNFVFIDNVILKPFTVQLPSAGTSVCQGQAVSVNLSCSYAFPGAIYTWKDGSGATIVSNSNGSLTYTANQSETLTLEVTLSGHTAYATYQISVASQSLGILAPEGSYCQNSDGSITTTLGNTNNITLTAPFSSTYQWYLNGNPIAGATAQQFTPNNQLAIGSTVVSVALDGGCTASITMLVVYNVCQMPCGTRLLGKTAYNQSLNYVNADHLYVTSSSLSVNSVFSGETVVIDGTFRVDGGTSVVFGNCNVLVSPGGQIIVEPGASLTFSHTTVDGCETMWNRIVNQGQLLAENSTFRHAEAAIEVTNHSGTLTRYCHFQDNVVGIFSRSSSQNPGGFYALNTLKVQATTFEGTSSGFLPPFPVTFSQYINFGAYPNTTTNPVIAQPLFSDKPASGIYLQKIANLDLASDEIYGPNMFLNMWNGIGLKDCGFTTIKNALFDGMEMNYPSNTTNAYHQIMPNIISPPNQAMYSNTSSRAISAINSDLELYPNAGNDSIHPTIQNCYQGVYVRGGSFNEFLTPSSFDHFFIRDVQVGIKLDWLISTKMARVFHFNIEANANGLEIMNCFSGSRSYFYNNEVRYIRRALVYLTGGSAFKIYNTTVNQTPTIIFRNNKFKVVGAGWGGYLRWAVGSWVQNNEIGLYDPLQGETTIGDFRGLYYLGGDHNLVNDNRIVCYRTNPTNGLSESAGIYLSFSNRNSLICNLTENMPAGLLFRYDCTLTRLGGNTINRCRIGLHMTRPLPSQAAPFIGIQPFRGNTWLSNGANYSIAAAKFDLNVGNSELGNNMFTIGNLLPPPAGRTFMPPSIAVANGSGNQWFITLPIQEDSTCSDYAALLPQDSNIGDIPSNGGVVQMMQLASLTSDNTLYGPESDWHKKKAFYVALSENPSFAEAQPTLTQVFDSLSTTPLAATIDAINQAEAAYAMQPNLLETLAALSTSAYNQYLVWQNHLQAGDSLQAMAAANEMAQILSQRQALYDQWSAEVDSKRIAAKAYIQTLVPTLQTEDNFKSMLDVYLSVQTAKGVQNLNEFEYDVFTVANQCPSSGGEAVFWARAMYGLLHPEASFNDSSLCEGVAANRMVLASNPDLPLATSGTFQPASLAKAWRIVPNPVADLLQVQGYGQQVVAWTVCNTFSQVLLKGTQPGGNFTPISIGHLPRGVYSLTLTQESGQRIVLKFVH